MCDSFNDNDNNYKGNNSRIKRKNEPEFEYLDGVVMEMDINFDLLNEDNASLAPCYTAESNLTPQMILANIMLNIQGDI